MKTLFIILFFITGSVFAASKSAEKKESDQIKWMKLGYEVAKTHFPSEQTAYQEIDKTCGNGNWKEFVADVDQGQDPYLVPQGYSRQIYYTDIGKDYLVYKCKDGKDANERRIGAI